MRRISIATALAVLASAAAAFAATANTYTGSVSFSPSQAGSVRKPSPLGIKLVFHAAGTGGNRATPLIETKDTLYGVVSNGRYFPTCSVAQIVNMKGDGGCPKGSLVASGTLKAIVGSVTNPAALGAVCAQNIHIYNAGQGKITVFNTGPPEKCFGTTFLPPFSGSLKSKSGSLVYDLLVPATLSFPIQGLEGSLLTEDLSFLRMTKTVHGHTVGFLESVGCQHRRRPYSSSFTAQGAGTVVIKGSALC